MASRRTELHEKLCEILGTSNVYYQPPESLKLNYPAIIYSLSDTYTRYANNVHYINLPMQYSLILVDKNPESEFFDLLNELPMCKFDRFYTSDNLNHFSFTIYY